MKVESISEGWRYRGMDVWQFNSINFGRISQKSQTDKVLSPCGFTYGRNKVSPDNEQMELTGTKCRKRHSASVEQIQDNRPIVLPSGYTSRPLYLQPSDTFLPSGNRNYTIVSPEKVDYFVKCRENALPYLSEILENSNNETQITETLYILDRMLDAKVEGIDKMYPVLARFNDTKSPNIQTFLAGIYRKTQMPDAFGPLVKMLVQNSIHPPKSNFDPNEEIGGAILSYLNPRFRG